MRILLSLILFVACATSTKPVVSETPTERNTKSFYTVKSSLTWVKEAVAITDCVTQNKDFHKDILNYPKYEHYSGTNQAIVDSLLSDKQAVVSTYKKTFSKARAYRTVGTPNIYINRAKIKVADKALIGTLMHERLHVLEYKHKGNQRNKYNNLESVPYKVNYMGQKYYEVCK